MNGNDDSALVNVLLGDLSYVFGFGFLLWVYDVPLSVVIDEPLGTENTISIYLLFGVLLLLINVYFLASRYDR